MPLWQWALDAVGVVLALVLCYGLALVVRRRFIARNGGTFELSFRVRTTRPGRGWVLGIGRYSGERLEWFRIFSISPWPSQVWVRPELSYSGRREPMGPEQLSLFSDHVVAICVTPTGTVELAMSPAALTGLQSWLEAGPPGAEIR